MHWYNQKMKVLDFIVKDFKRINRMKNVIITGVYSERNMLKQMNALKAKTKLPKETEKLLKLIYHRQSTLAGRLHSSLNVILKMIEKLEKEYDELEKELKIIDGMDEIEFLKSYGLLNPQGDYIKNIDEVDKR